jgi:hypothetical protein
VGFLETIASAKDFLRAHGRVSLRALQHEFGLDGDVLDELVEELVDVQQVAALEGKVPSRLVVGHPGLLDGNHGD